MQGDRSSYYPRRDREPPGSGSDQPDLEHRSAPARRRPSRGHPIAPTEFFKDRSAPELDRQAVRPTTPRLQHTALKRRIPRGRSRRPVGQRLPTAAYPRKSSKNLSQGPVIHRPHPHRKRTGLSEFRAPSRPPRGGGRSSARPPPKPEHAAARSARGRLPFKHGTVPVTILMVVKVLGGGRPGPSRAPYRKGQLKRPEAGPPRGCSGVLRTSFGPHPPPAVLFRGQRQGEESPNTHRNAGGQQGGRGGHGRVRRLQHRRAVRRRSPLAPTPSAHRSTAQGV